MNDFFQTFFGSGPFVPHGHCYLWHTPLVWLHVLSDGLIALAYYCIPIFLVALAHQRQDLPFRFLFWLFGGFIISCGTTHWMEVATLWYPAYWLSGTMKAITALLSVWTALELIPLFPKAVALPSIEQYELANRAAQAQVTELERLNQMKDDFLSTVSHELRTPISNIKMATQMLEVSLNHIGVLTDTSTPIHRYLNILREEEQREISLINDLLDLTRLDAGTEPLDSSEIHLHAYVPHIAESFAEQAHQHQQQLVIHIPADLPAISTHLPYLQRILTELLRNACKYTPAGETIHVSAQTVPDGTEIWVSNSGVEIAPKERERIFDKFYRIPNRDPWKYPGTGLGLALVKKMLHQIGGTITVRSSTDPSMTTFTIHLPNSIP